MPNSPYGPFGTGIATYFPGGVSMPLPTVPRYVDQGPQSRDYMEQLYGRRFSQNIPYTPMHLGSDDDELLDPPAYLRSLDWGDAYRQSGIGNIVNMVGDKINTGRDQFMNWLGGGPRATKGGEIARTAASDIKSGIDSVLENPPSRDAVIRNLPLAGPVYRGGKDVVDWLNSPPDGEGYQLPNFNTAFGAEGESAPGAAPTDMAGPGNYLPQGTDLLQHLTNTDPLRQSTPASASEAKVEDFGRSDFSPVGGMGFNDEPIENFGTAAEPGSQDSIEQTAKALETPRTKDGKREPSSVKDWAETLMTMGFATAASKQTTLAGALGEGGLAGLAARKDLRKEKAASAFKERELSLLEKRTQSAQVTAAAALLKASNENKPTKVKEFEYLKQLGWGDEDAGKAVKWLEDLDADSLKIVVAESAKMAALGIKVESDDLINLITQVRKARTATGVGVAPTGSTGQTRQQSGTIGTRVIRDPTTGKLVIQRN